MHRKLIVFSVKYINILGISVININIYVDKYIGMLVESMQIDEADDME